MHFAGRNAEREKTSQPQGESQVSELAKTFARTINMTPAQIRRWAKSPFSKLASLPHIRAELELLARTRETPPSRWTPAMESKARRAVAFVARHEAQMRIQGERYGTGRLHETPKRVISLLNWGRITPGISLPRKLLAQPVAQRRTSRTSRTSRRTRR